jgi:hypothetical protein
MGLRRSASSPVGFFASVKRDVRRAPNGRPDPDHEPTLLSRLDYALERK